MKRLLVIFLMLFSGNSFATHIVGGEMIYDFLGKTPAGDDLYRITLKLYRDCNNSNNAQFDGMGTAGSPDAFITIIGNGQETVVNIGSPVVSNVPPTINSNCVQVPFVCVQQGVYTTTLTLAPVPGGYYLIYQRCCRNNTILNLTNPGGQGSTYYAKIPGTDFGGENSSPRFKQFPPLFLCNDLPFYFDHSATDPDGDELFYALTGSFNGLDACCPALTGGQPGSSPNCPSPPPQCPSVASPPPYPGLNYKTPFSSAYPVASNPSITIDPLTGKLTGRPNMTGQFVVCIEVREYRNGQLIGIHYRDFQFNVTSCQITVISDMADQVFKCIGNVITFTNQSVSNTGALTYLWDFGVPGLSDDTSRVEHPTYTYQDTGKYTVTLIGNPGKTCSDTMRKEFYVYPELDVNFPPNAVQCVRNNSFDFELKGSYHHTAKFKWDFTSAATPSTSTDKNPHNIRFSDPGKYFVKLIGKQLMCVDSFIDSVRVLRGPTARIATPPLGICTPATMHFSDSSLSGEVYTSRWLFSNGKTSNLPEPAQTFTLPGVYSATLMIMVNGVCKDTSVASISHLTVHPLPKKGFIITPTLTTILDPLIQIKSKAGSGLSFDYDFGDGTRSYYHDPEHMYYDYGNYTITQYVTSAFGCTDSISDIIKILPEHRFWIPNAFTPNGDARNDLFRPVATGISDYELLVFDRWGKLLFDTNDPREGWDGSYKGEACKQDIYVWKVRYKDIVLFETFEREGRVTLIR